jgi:hypothetical protein
LNDCSVIKPELCSKLSGGDSERTANRFEPTGRGYAISAQPEVGLDLYIEEFALIQVARFAGFHLSTVT